MSSTGQIVGGIVGGVIGFFVGGGPAGAIKGAAIGASIGGYIDPPPGPDIIGPRLDDKSFQSSAYGVPIPFVDGTAALYGNIIWLENNEYKEVVNKEDVGGKGGGGGGTYTKSTYYATFAVALGEARPGSRARRVWLGPTLFYSESSDDFDSALQSAENALGFAFYDGSQTNPDSRMEAAIGVGRCPSYEGTAYIIFYDLDLTRFGNGLLGCPVKVEWTTGGYESSLSEGWDLRPVLLPNFISGSVNCKTIVHSAPGDSADKNPRIISLNIDLKDYSVSTIELSDDQIDAGFRAVSGDSDTEDYWYLTSRQSIPGGSYDVNIAVGGDLTVDYGPGYTFYRVFNKVETGLFVIGSQLFGESEDGYYLYQSVDDKIPLDASLSCVGVGDATVCVVHKSAIGDDFTVSVYLPNLVFVKSFVISLPGGFVNGVNITCPATIVDGVLYFLVVPGIQSGVMRIVRVDLDSEQHRYFDVTPPGSWAISSVGQAHAILVRGSIIELIIPAGAVPVTLNTNISVFRVLDFYSSNVESVLLNDLITARFSSSGIGSEMLNLEATEEIYVDGYIFSGPGSSRGALAPLQVSYLFDFVEVGYVIATVVRGSAPDEIVPYQHLDARLYGDAPGVLIERVHETDSQLPRRYSISYLDYNREYDSNTQYADYPTRSMNERNEQLPVVLTETQAAKIADILINLSWIERDTFTFRLPQLYLHWVSGDVKSVEVRPGVLLSFRIQEISKLADQRVEISAKLTQPEVYQSSALGAVVDGPVETVQRISDSVALLLDIPLIVDDMDSPGYVGAMYGAGSWPGGVVARSIDNGQVYTVLQGFTGQSTVARCNNSLSQNDGYVIDRSGTLNISQLAGEFSSITEEQMMTGQNYCAYGVDGRWEILRYAHAVLESDGSKTLSVFARGLRGTEWATGLHATGDKIVFLDDADNIFIGSDLSGLGMPRLYKAATVGKNIQDIDPFTFSYHAVNLKPLSAVLIQGEQIDNDWYVSWVERSRFSSSYWYTGVQPLGEASGNWEIEILDDLGGVVRTVQSEDVSFVYSEEDQIQDFGSPQEFITVIIYSLSDRVGRGYPAQVTL